MKEQQKHTIIKGRVEIYSDFTLNLLRYIDKYYIDGALESDEDIKNHFNFCYSKVCSEFEKESISFRGNSELREYFHTYHYHQYYKTPQRFPLQTYIDFWRNLFTVSGQKTQKEMRVLIEIYLLFDRSISSAEKNILELV